MFVKAIEVKDGIGGQLARKLVALKYAIDNDLEYFHEPIDDIMWHPGDCFSNDKEKQALIAKVNSLFEYKNKLDVIDDSLVTYPDHFLESDSWHEIRGTLKKFPKEKKIVIHVRRGNIVLDRNINNRYTSDETYRRLFIKLEAFIKMYQLEDHEIVILTDSPIDSPEYIDTPDDDRWRRQVGMNVFGEITKLEPFNTSVLNPRLKYTIINNLCSYESLKLMLSADWLFASNSSFSIAVALGGHYNVVVPTAVMPPCKIAHRGHTVEEEKDLILIVDDNIL